MAALCAIAVPVFALSGCGGGDDSSAETVPPRETENASEKKLPSSGIGPAKVFRADAGSLQAVVFDESGYALYRFDKDKGSTSTCYGACAKQWPPLLTEGTPIAYAVIPQELGITERKDGTTQVTYFGHPLYSFVGNKKYPTGKVPGNGVKAFGGTWYAMHRTGQDVKQ